MSRRSTPLRTLLRRGLLLVGLCACRCGPASEAAPPEEPRAETGEHRIPGAQDPERAARHRQEGREHLQAGRYREAREALEQAWLLDVAQEQGALELADLLLSNILEADADLALEVLERTFGMDTPHLAARRLLARGAYRARRPELARRMATGLVQDPATPAPWRGEARFVLGSLAEDAGDFPTAAVEYRHALDERPDRALYSCRLGIALEETGEEAEALECYRRAIRMEPENREAHFRLAGLLRRLGREEEALREGRIHRALNQASDSLARTPAAFHERRLALAELETLLPGYVQGRLLLCELLLVEEDPGSAAAAARRLIDDHPQTVRAYALWIEAMRRDRGDEETRRALRTLLLEVADMPATVRQEAMDLALRGFRQ